MDVSVDVRADAVIRVLEALGDKAESAILDASQETAEAIAREARTRLARQLNRTPAPATKRRPDRGQGLTLAGIQALRARDGDGYVVVSEREPFPALPLWIEKGTKKGAAGSHSQAPRPYFYASAELEAEQHLRRLEQAIDDVLAGEGLGV